MKKLAAVVLTLALLFSFALADDIDSFISRWNTYAKYYPCPEITKDIASLNEGNMVFIGDTWRMVVSPDYKQAAVYAEDLETLLANSTVIGLMTVGDTKNLSNYLGYLIRMYFDLKKGNKVIPMYYGSYAYELSEINNGYMMTLVD